MNATYDTSSNYCTGWFDRIDLPFWKGDWSYCCFQHDLRYDSTEFILPTNWEFYECVTQAGGPVMGTIMFLGVTLGMAVFYPWRKRLAKRRG